jgi:predicted nucleic acid-binding protein
MAGVVFDSTFLIDLLNPKIAGDQRAALDHLVNSLSQTRTRILIPSPCLTELLIRAGKARDEYVQKLSNTASFEVIAFDRRAATECALLLEEAWDKKTQSAISRTKFKYDWMIVSCAASRGASKIYSDDGDIARCAKQVNIETIAQKNLVVPAESRQMRIDDVE